MIGARVAAAWVRASDRHAGLLFLVAVVLAAAGAWGTARLYRDLRADLTELLPARAPSAIDAARVSERVGGWAEETVALHGDDPALLRRFADALAPRLEAIPDVVASVEYRLDEARRFFQARAALFLDLADLERLRDLMARKDHAGLLGFAARLANNEANREATALFQRFPDGYFLRATRDPEGRPTHALVIRVRLAGNPNDFRRIDGLDRAVRQAVAALRHERGPEPLEVDLGGYVASTKFEHDGLAEDLVVATLAVLLAVALVMALFYGTAKAVPAIGAPPVSYTHLTLPTILRV